MECEEDNIFELNLLTLLLASVEIRESLRRYSEEDDEESDDDYQYIVFFVSKVQHSCGQNRRKFESHIHFEIYFTTPIILPKLILIPSML